METGHLKARLFYCRLSSHTRCRRQAVSFFRATLPGQKSKSHEATSAMNTPPVDSSTWVLPGKTIRVGGYTIDGGMFYLGGGLPFAVKPWLPVAEPDCPNFPPYFQEPAYETFSTEERGAYLEWLSYDRKGLAQPPHHFLSLFYFGLEFRLLHDRDYSESLADAILGLVESYDAQMRGLPWTKFLHCWAFLNGPNRHCELLPGLSNQDRCGLDRDEMRLAGASLASAGVPLSGEIAYEFARRHPNLRSRKPHSSGRETLRQDFLRRFDKRFPGGFPLKCAWSEIDYHYLAACPYLRKCDLPVTRLRVPDVFNANDNFKEFTQIWDQILQENPMFSCSVNEQKVQMLNEETRAVHAILAPYFREEDTRVGSVDTSNPNQF